RRRHRHDRPRLPAPLGAEPVRRDRGRRHPVAPDGAAAARGGMIFWSELAGVDTPRFQMRPLAPSDAGDLFAHLADPAVTQFMDIDPLERQEQAMGIIEWAQDLRGQGGGVRYALRERDTGLFIGSCGFNSIVTERGCRGEIAYDLKRAWWGKGVMAEVL